MNFKKEWERVKSAPRDLEVLREVMEEVAGTLASPGTDLPHGSVEATLEPDDGTACGCTGDSHEVEGHSRWKAKFSGQSVVGEDEDGSPEYRDVAVAGIGKIPGTAVLDALEEAESVFRDLDRVVAARDPDRRHEAE